MIIIFNIFSSGYGTGKGRYDRVKAGRRRKVNKETWQKNQTKNAKASGKEYISQRTGKKQKAKVVCVSKILWYIINL